MANVEKGTHGPNLEKGNWVVAPIPVSNPTMGTGLQLATLYLHPSRDGNGGPNPTSGLGAMYTDTDSWVVGPFIRITCWMTVCGSRRRRVPVL
ncbi:MAG: hypothetical protein ACPH5V_12295 [Alcanivorax sp.]